VAQIDDIRTELGALDRTLASIEAVLDLPAKRVKIAELEEQSAAPDLWNDQEHAQKVTSRLSRLKAEVDRIMSIRVRLDDLSVLVDLARRSPIPALSRRCAARSTGSNRRSRHSRFAPCCRGSTTSVTR